MAVPCQKSSSGLVLDNTSARVLDNTSTALRQVGTCSAGEILKYHEDAWEENPAMSLMDLFGDHKVEALREDGANASQSTVCLQEDLETSEDDGWTELPNSDDESLTWEDLAGVDTQVQDFASDEEELQFYLDLAQHLGEVEDETARHAVSHKTRTRREKLRWRMTGRRRARRVGSGGARASLPSIAEEEWDTFTEKVDAGLAQQRGQDGRVIYTRTLRE
eukprot:4963802-Amphidinium_carterae.2